jgi:2-oxoisovalerate ferredoxin oxidoreductase beta subunit
MTGGQMAPTSLLGQKTVTSPFGRQPAMGKPIRMAELIAQLDGPAYVERVALFDARQRVRARRAIQKALRVQLEGHGYSFVEILCECPTHLKASPQKAQEWVRTQMVPVFPLGVKKDLTPEPGAAPPELNYEPELLLRLNGVEAAADHVAAPPMGAHNLGAKDLSLKFAGAGGDGAQVAALLLTRAAIAEGFDSTHIPSYGPESRGGTSYADVHIAQGEVLNPAAPEPQILVAFNAPSLAKFASTVPPGGLILYDQTVIAEPPGPLPDRRVLAVPFTQLATNLGRSMVKNVVALGALQAATDLLPSERLLETMRRLFKDKPELVALNEAAFAAGQEAAKPVTA